jgi:hypothetical protein
MTEREDFDLQGGSLRMEAARNAQKADKTAGWRQPAQVSHF